MSSENVRLDQNAIKTFVTKQGKGMFYIAQYPVRWTAQSTLHFTTWQTRLFRHQHVFSGNHSSHAPITRND